jgi:hypothetical protein
MLEVIFISIKLTLTSRRVKCEQDNFSFNRQVWLILCFPFVDCAASNYESQVWLTYWYICRFHGFYKFTCRRGS